VPDAFLARGSNLSKQAWPAAPAVGHLWDFITGQGKMALALLVGLHGKPNPINLTMR
jgi:hypothetical protein